MNDRYKTLMERSINDAIELSMYEIGDEDEMNVDQEFVMNVALGLFRQRCMRYNEKRMMAKQLSNNFSGNPDMGRM